MPLERGTKNYYSIIQGEKSMRESTDRYADLEDLLFEPDAGGPSER